MMKKMKMKMMIEVWVEERVREMVLGVDVMMKVERREKRKRVWIGWVEVDEKHKKGKKGELGENAKEDLKRAYPVRILIIFSEKKKMIAYPGLGPGFGVLRRW
ncbi:hypothetical protein VNO80_05053 [Phaseolus coccineus]|uniref:Uncharacterized protein n=1 Tax=Phaseolus coccineus TaxID=3886 RepID=A0AAN9NUH8_PHACN